MKNINVIKKPETVYEQIDFNEFTVLTSLPCIPAHCKSYLVSVEMEDIKAVIPLMFRKYSQKKFELFEDGYYDRRIFVTATIPDENIVKDIKYHDEITKNYFDVPVLIRFEVIPEEDGFCEKRKVENLCADFYDNAEFKVLLDGFHNKMILKNNPKTNRIEFYVDEEVNN